MDKELNDVVTNLINELIPEKSNLIKLLKQGADKFQKTVEASIDKTNYELGRKSHLNLLELNRSLVQVANDIMAYRNCDRHEAERIVFQFLNDYAMQYLRDQFRILLLTPEEVDKAVEKLDANKPATASE